MQGQAVGMHGVLPNGANQIPNINGLGNTQLNGGPIPLAMRVPGAVPNISQQGNANLMASAQRGPNGEIITPINSAVLLLQQQQAQQQRMAAAMANGSPPRPQSATSMISQGAMGSQAQMLAARQAAMQDPGLRAQIAMQMSQMSGLQDSMALYRQQQQQLQQAQAHAQARAQQMTAAGLQQQQQQQQQNQPPPSSS